MPIKVTFVCNRCEATATGEKSAPPAGWCTVNVTKMVPLPAVRSTSHGGILCVSCSANAIGALKLEIVSVPGVPNANT